MALDLFETARANAEAQAARSPIRGDELVHLDWAAVFAAVGAIALVAAFIAWVIFADRPHENPGKN